VIRRRRKVINSRRVFADVETATILKPGDRVLLTVNPQWTPAMVHRAEEIFAERFPGVTFGFAGGVESVVVMPKGRDANP
jgi:hypothetical protein